MSLRVIVLPALVLVACSVSVAAIPTPRFTISARDPAGKVDYLAARRGELVLGRPSPTGDGGLDLKDAPDRWFFFDGRIKSSVGEGYLAYDPSGKDNRAFLSPK